MTDQPMQVIKDGVYVLPNGVPVSIKNIKYPDNWDTMTMEEKFKYLNQNHPH